MARYDEQFKIEAVKMLLNKGETIAKVAKKLGVSQGSLKDWKKKYSSKLGNGTTTAADLELINLRREMDQLRKENEILKKAAVAPAHRFFAKESL